MSKLKFQFKPSLLGIVMTMIAVSLFGSLAIWQIDRAEQRNLLRQKVVERSQLPIMELNREKHDLDSDRYKRFLINGHFINQNQVLLDNVVRHGKAGYIVITPFRLVNGQAVMVDRGWVPAPSSRAQVPDVPVDQDQHELIVMMDKFRSAPVVGVDAQADLGRWNYVDTTLYNQQVGYDMPGYVLRLSPDSNLGYEKKWPVIEDKSGMHIGYAIQWAVFALIALGTFISVSIKRKEV